MSPSPASPPLLEIADLVVDFEGPSGRVRAVDGVCLALARGETLGLVGESGCGKTTVVRAVVGLVRPTAGEVRFRGERVVDLRARALRSFRRHVQMVFQDPHGSLDPRRTIGAAIAEPLWIHRTVAREDLGPAVARLLAQVGLDPALARRYPHEFSGGQRQRVGLARALALEPQLLLLDEPVSALDTAVQAQVLNLLVDLRARLELTYLLVAHNLAVVRHMSDRVAVMYRGRIVEIGDAEAIYRAPMHPYTQALLAAVPVPDPTVARQRAWAHLEGEVGSAGVPGSGCAFRPRCPLAALRCGAEVPPLAMHRPGHRAACHQLGQEESNHGSA